MWLGKGLTEFLNAAIMQSHDCTIYLRIRANKFWTIERETGKTGTNFMYLSQFDNVFNGSHVSVQKKLPENFDCAKKKYQTILIAKKCF